MSPSREHRSEVYEIADEFVERFAALHPLAATGEGITGHDHEMTDFSPDGIDERAEHNRAALRTLRAAPVTDDADRIAAGVLAERLELSLEEHDAGERLRDVRILGSPIQGVRMVFDLVSRDTTEQWQVIAERLRARPAGTREHRGRAHGGRATGHRGRTPPSGRVRPAGRRVGRARRHPPVLPHDGRRLRPTRLRRRPRSSAGSRSSRRGRPPRTRRWPRYLVDEYPPHAVEHDPVGRDRYSLYARDFTGIELDLDETYAWGWDELHRIEHAMQSVAERILPGADVDQVIEHLETDPNRAIEGVEEFRRWNQELLDTTVAELDGTHFDIPDPVKRVEAMIAPPGGAAAMYYTGPSEDFSRPGRTWYPTLGKTRFPLWGEVSICYHEGVPGITCRSPRCAISPTHSAATSARSRARPGTPRDGRCTRSG